MNYKEYLQSDHWGFVKAKKLYFCKKQCCICESKSRLEVHHKTYKNLGKEDLDDLIIVCRICHQSIHDEQDRTGRPLEDFVPVKEDKKKKETHFMNTKKWKKINSKPTR